jgi:hypothetical protein
LAAYAGSGNFPYAITVANNGVTSGAGMQSENVPAQAGLTYQFQVVCSYASTWASGMSVSLAFYNSSNVIIGSAFTASSGAMTGGQLYAVSTGEVLAPAGTSYCIAQVTQTGLPGSALSVYQAEVDDQNNNQVNVNYAFSWTFWPWTAVASAVLAWTAQNLLAGDSDSLVLDGIIELMGGAQGVPCTIPEMADSNGQGPVFRILAPPSLNNAAYGYEASYDLNAPQPTQDVVASMLLDGERPFGARSSNRTMTLPIIIFGTQAGGMSQVLKAREYLMSVIDQQVYPLKWTPADTGLATVFDCFRALPSTPLYGFNYSAGGSATNSTIGRPNYPIAMITLTIQALPFGRSDIDGVQQLAFGNPIVNGVQPASPVTVDSFTEVFAPPPVIGSPTWTTLGTSNPTSVSSWNIAIGANVAATNTVVVEVEAPAGTITGVTDTQGNVYGLAVSGQVGTEALWQYVYTALVKTALTSGTDHVTVTSSASTSPSSAAYSVTGSWQPRAALPVNIDNYVTNYGFNLTGLNPYDMLLSVTSGLGSSGSLPGGFTSIGTPSGNGLNATVSWYAMPVGQTALSYGVTTLPIPSQLLLIALQPVNQYWSRDASSAPGGGTSAKYNAPRPMHTPWPAATYSQTLPSPVNITGLPVLSVWFGQAYDTQWPADPKYTSNVTLAWTLTDTSGRTLSFSKAQKKVLFGANATMAKWTQINAPVPQGKAFGYNAVASYSVRVTNWSGSGHTGYVRMHCWLNRLTANPQTLQTQISPRGNVYNLFALPGTARAPVSVQCQLPAGQAIAKELTASGTFIVPPGVYSLEAEAWGGGGAGASVDVGRALCGGGGGGGEYAAEPALAVLPGAQVPYTIGSAGLAAQISSTVIQFTQAGVIAHWTCPANVTSVLAECWGGGGAGASGGGGGGGGAYSSKTITVTPGVTYWAYVGTAGKADVGTTSAQVGARTGGGSWFGNAGTKYLVTSLVGGTGGNTAITGGTSGGAGGANVGAPGTTHRNGGRGGSSPGPSGGGGGGAAGSGAAGGAGGDSQPHLTTGGVNWQTGGLGGTGGGGGTSGGNGGAGASTPGFPAVGSQPGGGGGGGYTSGTLATTAQAAVNLPGTKSVNYLGADGGAGMVQLTYQINGGSPLAGGSTVFGSAATTGTVVTAHGGSSAAVNSATGAAGGTGSSNTVHDNGGAGGLLTSGSLGSYMTGNPGTGTGPSLTYLNSMSYNSTGGTSGGAGASVSQGVALALIESAGPVTDLAVIDSAGNVYQPTGGSQGGGSAGTGVTAYGFVANIEFPVTTSTTLAVTSATSQEYGVLWAASPYLASGVTSGNLGSGNGTGATASGQFGASDTSSLEVELAVVVQDGGTTVSSLPGNLGKIWYQAASTYTVTAGTLNLSAYTIKNQGGGTDNAGSGDTFSATLSGSANWAVLCIPLLLMNQQADVIQLDWRSGTTPGAQTTWGTEAAISANGMILVVGMAGSGAGVTAGPTAMADSGGNHYTTQKTQVIPSSGGVMWMTTAPVTAALAAGATGTYNWGGASAAPEYAVATYWIPNAVGVDAHGASAVTGSGTAASGSYTPASPNDTLVGAIGAVVASETFGAAAAPFNLMDTLAQSYLHDQLWAAQITDEAATTLSSTLGTTAPWCEMLIGFTMPLAGSGGGAAGGPGAPGYPGVWQQGAPGLAGANSGKGGTGAGTLNTGGGSAALPGGGGGGAYASNTGANQGGQGGGGMVRVTWTPPLTAMNNLIVHSLGANTDPNVNPICPIPVTDAPNNTEYAVPSVSGLVPATFSSSYTVLLVANSWNSSTAGSARQITVTINQYEYPGGPRYSVQASRAVTPATDIVNGFVNLGEVTLPLKDYTAYNDQSYFTLSVNDTDIADRFMDVLFLDTTGQTALINIGQGNPGYGQYVNYFLDEATPDRDLGFVGASFQDRQHQVSVLDSAMISGGALYIQAGDNLLLCYSTAGAPDLALTYAPRWFLDRAVLC